MTDLERQLTAEFSRVAATAPDPAGTERFAEDLVRRGRAIPVRGDERSHAQRAWRRWLLPVAAALVVAVPVVAVALLHDGGTTTPAPVSRSSAPAPADITGREWLLISVRGTDGVDQAFTGPADAGVDLRTAGRVDFNDGCNDIYGDLALSDRHFPVVNTASSAVGCPSGTPPLAGLADAASTWSLSAGRLAISNPAVGTATFALPTDPAVVYGRTWTLTAWRGADGKPHPFADNDAMSLRIDPDGTTHFGDGCRTGHAVVTPGRIGFDRVAVLGPACGHAGAAIASGTVTWTIDKGTLTLVGATQGREAFTASG